MQLQDYPFDSLPFSKLFRTYISDYSKLAAYFSADPFDLSAIAEHARNVTLSGDRAEKVELLATFNKRFDLDEAAVKNLQRLKDDDALALVTGQQLGLYGGPLYTVLKTVTVIHQSRKLERELGRPVIPVFWLADEDHDFEEVNAVRFFDGDEVTSLGLDQSRDTGLPVAEMELPPDFGSFRERVAEGLRDTDFSNTLWKQLDRCYRQGTRMDEAFGRLISSLFSRYGLILAGSNCKPIKNASVSSLKLAISKADEVAGRLEEQSSELEQQYHRQAAIHDSNLFYLDPEDGRTKIMRNGDGWKTDTGKSWATDELLDEIDAEPSRFSPNVFLRPLVQDMLVPTLGYVAGPGELAYYGQMKKVYELFDCAMPVIFPRMSATVVEPAIERIIGELPFGISDYEQRIEDLVSDYVTQTEKHDIEAIFSDWKQKVEEISDSHTAAITEIDPTLEGASGKATAVFFGELDKLKGKVYRAVKQQDETQLQRIRRIKANLFPENTLQERVISCIYFMNKYGTDLWDRLLDELDDDEEFSGHKLIYL